MKRTREEGERKLVEDWKKKSVKKRLQTTVRGGLWCIRGSGQLRGSEEAKESKEHCMRDDVSTLLPCISFLGGKRKENKTPSIIISALSSLLSC